MTDVWEEKREEEIANNKEDVIKTKINHHIKHNSYTFDELFNICQEINVFKPSLDMFSKAIEYMTKMEYISLDSETQKYQKILY